MKIPLPFGVLPIHARKEAAHRLGITVDSVVDIIQGNVAWRDGKLIEEAAFYDAYPDDDLFDDFTGADVLPKDLLVYAIEVPRDPRQRLTPPISASDVLAADVLAVVDHVELVKNRRSVPAGARLARCFRQSAKTSARRARRRRNGSR